MCIVSRANTLSGDLLKIVCIYNIEYVWRRFGFNIGDGELISLVKQKLSVPGDF
jgi:hypothetical protein